MLSAEVDFGDGYRRVDANSQSQDWRELLALRPNPPAKCRSCHAPVTGAEGESRTPHFKHLNTSKRCVFLHESENHRRLKLEVAATINDMAGWTASTEHREPDGNWIADVLAIRTDATSTSVAFEIQLSPQDKPWGDERQQRRTQSGVDCLWLVGPRGQGAGPHNIEIPDPDVSVVQIGTYDHDDNPRTSLYPPATKLTTIPLATAVETYLSDDLQFIEGMKEPLLASQHPSYRQHLMSHKAWVEEQTDRQRSYSQALESKVATAKHVAVQLLSEHGPPLRVGGDSDTWAANIDDNRWDKTPGHHTINSLSDIAAITHAIRSTEWGNGIAIRQGAKVIAIVSPDAERIRHIQQFQDVAVYSSTDDHDAVQRALRTIPVTVVDASFARQVKTVPTPAPLFPPNPSDGNQWTPNKSKSSDTTRS